MRLQPGVQRILAELPPGARILDLGCGNGEFWRALQATGFQGSYVGLDFSAELLEIAAGPQGTPPVSGTGAFIQADISAPDWETKLPADHFDVIVAFAVLHHIPSHDLRLGILQKIRTLLVSHGAFIHSEWQFLNSARLRKRVQPWGTIDLCDDELEDGDYLLDWRHGGYGLRYVHHFSEHELADLAHECGFQVTNAFQSDGEGGQLGLYQVWRPL